MWTVYGSLKKNQPDLESTNILSHNSLVTGDGKDRYTNNWIFQKHVHKFTLGLLLFLDGLFWVKEHKDVDIQQCHLFNKNKCYVLV